MSLKRRLKASYLLLVLCLAWGGCAFSAAGKPHDFNGRWVVDMAASQAINPSLSQREDTRQFMAKITMELDVDQRVMSIIYDGMKEWMVMLFTVTDHQPGWMALKIDDGHDELTIIHLRLKNGRLIFEAPDQPGRRDDFVFVRKP